MNREQTDDEESLPTQTNQESRVGPVEAHSNHQNSFLRRSETAAAQDYATADEIYEDTAQVNINSLKIDGEVFRFEARALEKAVEKCLAYSKYSRPRLEQLAGFSAVRDQKIAVDWAEQTLAAWCALLRAQAIGATVAQKRLAGRYNWYTYSPDDVEAFQDDGAFSKALNLQRNGEEA